MKERKEREKNSMEEKGGEAAYGAKGTAEVTRACLTIMQEEEGGEKEDSMGRGLQLGRARGGAWPAAQWSLGLRARGACQSCG